jgi:nanoRNase/pAp phosphatase (c-di-AMP/oligoRNAs hydrolase)
MSRTTDSAERLAKLGVVLAGARSMLIVLQDNPDPDAIAAAAALREVAHRRHGIACSIAHGGTIGRAENLALVRYLGLNTRGLASVELERFDRLAMVDAQPGAGNVGLRPGARPDVVVDHHPIRRETRSARFTDIRSSYGATSTILHQYLRAAGIDIDPPLATALVYGIRSDTQDLGRKTTRADLDAYLGLYPQANLRALARIVSAPLPRAYFAKLRRALDNATVYDVRVVSFLASLDSQDMVAEAADLLLRVEDMTWSLCLGVVGGWLHASVRSTDPEHNAGAVARKLAARRGFGGGHRMLAAAQIPLLPEEIADPARLRRFVERLIQRFLRATGAANSTGQHLCVE